MVLLPSRNAWRVVERRGEAGCPARRQDGRPGSPARGASTALPLPRRRAPAPRQVSPGAAPSGPGAAHRVVGRHFYAESLTATGSSSSSPNDEKVTAQPLTTEKDPESWMPFTWTRRRRTQGGKRPPVSSSSSRTTERKRQSPSKVISRLRCCLGFRRRYHERPVDGKSHPIGRVERREFSPEGVTFAGKGLGTPATSFVFSLLGAEPCDVEDLVANSAPVGTPCCPGCVRSRRGGRQRRRAGESEERNSYPSLKIGSG
jgi:hypothetical protein